MSNKPKSKSSLKSTTASAAAAPPAPPSPKPAASKRQRPKAEGGAPRAGGLNAALTVLSAAKAPMNVRDIAKAAIAKGLWKPEGKTPWATLASAIGREIKTKGKQSRFKKTGRGLFEAVSAR